MSDPRFPPNTHRADELYAVLSVDANGYEGIVAADVDDKPVPLVTSERANIEQFERWVREMADEWPPGMRIRLVTFTRASERLLWER